MRYLLQTPVINCNFVLIEYFPRNVMVSFLCKYVYIIIWTYFDILTGLSTSATVFRVLLGHQDDLDVYVISTIEFTFFTVLKTALVLNPTYHTAFQIYQIGNSPTRRMYAFCMIFRIYRDYLAYQRWIISLRNGYTHFFVKQKNDD